MSVFGLFIGALIIFIVFTSNQARKTNESIQELASNLKQRKINIPNFVDNLPSEQGIANMAPLTYGPYWNTFYTPTNWNVDDQYLWPYWVWSQRGFLMPGPLYPYYNG